LFSFFSSLIPRPPISTLFPYTTLFRSIYGESRELILEQGDLVFELLIGHLRGDSGCNRFSKNIDRDFALNSGGAPRIQRKVAVRSEEHTSELQSRGHLVCRLLLEKKKK